MNLPAHEARKPKRRWLRRAAFLLAVLLLAQFGFNLWLQSKRKGAGYLHTLLVRRLETTFGRTVEVGSFQLSLFGQPHFDANYITVAEDPRFGHEYFLSAEQLSASLRWRSLLRGRIELGTLSFTRPSLNLVRSAAGEWNLESWLPAPTTSGPAPVPSRSFGTGPESSGRGRIYRVEVDGGRVNFKRGYDKHPFALVEVTGAMEQESPGRWRVDLESQLMRSTVTVQEAGTIRVRGHIGSTAERLRPAELQVTWEEASLADLLRLTRERDFGVRGEVSLDVTARSGVEDRPAPTASGPARSPGREFPASAWFFSGVARFRGIHRWDLPPHSNDPAVNLSFDAIWSPEAARVELTRGVIDAPGSSIRAVGFLAWGAELPSGKDAATSLVKVKDSSLRFTSSGIALHDMFAWYRAFRPGVAENAVLEGNAGLDLRLTGWPPRIEQGVLAADGMRLRVPGLAGPVSVGRVLIRSERGALVLPAVALALPGPASLQGAVTPPGGKSPLRMGRRGQPLPVAPALHLEGRAIPLENRVELKLAGQIESAPDALATLSALGWNLFSGWTMEGETSLNVRWQGSVVPFRASLAGTLDSRRLRLRAPFLTQPFLLREARAEFDGGARQVRFVAAEAFGARWTGSLSRKDFAAPWEFTLAAERLNVNEMSRWFGQPERGGLLGRLRQGPAAAQATGSSPLEARGRVEIGQFLLAPLVAQRVRAQIELSGTPWRLRLREAQADFYGGSVNGTFDADGGTEPVFRFDGRFQRVSLEGLTGPTAALARRFAGVAGGEISLVARGRGRDDLMASLAGRGSLEVRNAEIRGMDLASWLKNAAAIRLARPVSSSFSSASANFIVDSSAIRIEKMNLVTPQAEIEASGTVDFAQALNLTLRPLPPRVAAGRPVAIPSGSAASRGLRITGTLRAPQVAPLDAPSPR